MPGEPIGNIAVVIDGDFSALDKALGQSVIAAELGGGKIAQAFNTAAGSTDEWTQALNHSTTATEAETDAIGAAADKFHGYSTAVENVLGPERDHLDDLAQMPKSYTEMSAAAQRAVDKLNEQTAAAAAAARSTGTLSDALVAFGRTTVDAKTGSDSLLSSLLQFGGIALTLAGIKTAIADTFEAFSRVERATESLTALTGSSRVAETEIQKLRILATDEGLSFATLLKADQNMRAFGLSAAQITPLLKAAADAGVATGRGFDATSASIMRLVEGGMAGSRQLVQLGLSSKDLAGVLGVTTDQVSKLFKGLEESARAEVATAALQKFKDLAEKTAHDTAGSWQDLKNEADKQFAAIGAAIAPATQEFMRFASETIKELGSVIQNVEAVGTAFGMLGTNVVASLAAIAVAIRGNPMAALGLEIIQLGLAWRGYSDAAAEAVKASNDDAVALGRLQGSVRELFAGNSDFLQQFDGYIKALARGGIQQDEFNRLTRDLITNYRELHPLAASAASSTLTFIQQLDALKAKLEDGTYTQARYKEELQKLLAAHSEATSKTHAHTLSAGELLEKQAKLTEQLSIAQTAVDNLTVLEGKGVTVTGALAEAKTQLTKIQKELGIATDAGALAIFKELEQQKLAIEKAHDAKVAFEDTVVTYGRGSTEATVALGLLNKALKAIGQDQVDVNGALSLFQPELADTAKKIEMIAGASQDTGAALSITTKQVGDQVSILSDLNRGLEIVDTSMLQNILKTGSWTDYLNALNAAQRQAKAESQALDTVEGSLSASFDKVARAADGSLIANEKANEGMKVFDGTAKVIRGDMDNYTLSFQTAAIETKDFGDTFDGMEVQVSGSKQALSDATDAAKNAAETLKNTTGPAFEVLTGSVSAARSTLNALTESYQNQTKMADGHIAKLSEIRKAQEALNEAIKHGKTAYDDIGAAGTKALEDLRASGKSSVQIATQFNQVVDATGGIIQKSFNTGTSAVEKFLDAVGKSIDKLNAMETSILKAAERWDAFQKDLNIAGGIGDKSGGSSFKLSNPYWGLSIEEMKRQYALAIDSVAGSSPFSPGARAFYTAQTQLFNAAYQEAMKLARGEFPEAQSTTSGASPSSTQTPTKASAPVSAPMAAPVAPEIQALLNIGATIDQIATLQTSIGTLNTTVANASTTISGSFASLSPVIQQATTQIAASVQQQAASFSRLSDVLAPITAPQQTISGPLASFQRLPDPRVLGGNSSTLNTVNNMTITTTPDEQSLLDQLVIMLQRRGIRM